MVVAVIRDRDHIGRLAGLRQCRELGQFRPRPWVGGLEHERGGGQVAIVWNVLDHTNIENSADCTIRNHQRSTPPNGEVRLEGFHIFRRRREQIDVDDDRLGLLGESLRARVSPDRRGLDGTHRSGQGVIPRVEIGKVGRGRNVVAVELGYCDGRHQARTSSASLASVGVSTLIIVSP